ncbi:MAG: hypothetical protein Tsb009_12580 [Planctomycetaceae bacterium]
MSFPPEQSEASLDGFPVESSGDLTRGREPVEVLATEFLEKSRSGENPSIEDYVQQNPDLAAQIREFFPVILAMERWKHNEESRQVRSRIPENFHVERLGDCRILREIGRGGMGVVYEGEQQQPRRRVAIKLLPWNVADVPHARERFQREVHTLSQLNHPNIVPLYDHGEYEDFHFFIMPFIRGVGLDWMIGQLGQTEGVVYAEEIARKMDVSLEEAKNQNSSKETVFYWSDWERSSHEHRSLRRNAWKQFALIGLQAANALRYAHARRIIHNDIKPGNILLDADGRVWVTDFGLAHSIDDNSANPEGRLSGTLRYMAPERFSGVSDPRSDIYSMGMTLYELCTLKPAFTGNSPEAMIARIADSEPIRPSDLNSEIPADLETIILTAIAKKPSRRYQSAGDLASDLLRFINGRSIRAGKRNLLIKIGSWLRRPFQRR